MDVDCGNQGQLPQVSVFAAVVPMLAVAPNPLPAFRQRKAVKGSDPSESKIYTRRANPVGFGTRPGSGRVCHDSRGYNRPPSFR